MAIKVVQARENFRDLILKNYWSNGLHLTLDSLEQTWSMYLDELLKKGEITAKQSRTWKCPRIGHK